MALINCPSCGKQISNMAPVCPYCGYHMKPIANSVESQRNNNSKRLPVRKVNIILFVVSAVIVLALAGYFAYDKFYLQPIRVAEAVAAENARIEAEYQERQRLEAEQRAKEQLERFKKFQTKDLACFMLHGRVKTMTECGETLKTVYNFSEEGSLISVVSIRDNKLDNSTRVEHKGGKLVFHHDYGADEYNYYGESKYEVDENMHLVRFTFEDPDFRDYVEFHDYDSHGWPLKLRLTSYEPDADPQVTTKTYDYSDIDEYGNWRSDGESTRTIEYYPVENF